MEGRRIVTTASVVVIATVMVSGWQAPSASSEIRALTVPESQLPLDCRLVSAAPTQSGPTSGTIVVSSDAVGAGINPWIGTDVGRLASIRESIEGGPLLPDPVAITPSARARFRAKLAEGVAEGYEAFYAGPNGERLPVRGLRFSEPSQATSSGARQPVPSPRRRIERVAFDGIVAVVSGPAGQCFDAIARHLQAFSR
jgi:hypothetical protein